jgi:hypothetical protein
MAGTILTYEPAIRLIAFAYIFVTLAVWGPLSPRRGRQFGRGLRWPSNCMLTQPFRDDTRRYPLGAVRRSTISSP